MEQIKFKCTFLSDVILNVKSASEGENSTLDFIPGSNFMGIVASQLYADNDPDTMLIVHSGQVKFGDAHPLCNGIRSLRTPAALFYPKLSSVENECIVHHEYNRNNDEKKPQLKQCRSGFYAFDTTEKKAVGINPLTNYALKSAYDRLNRKSKDSQMYGYESISEGSEYCFSVVAPDEKLAEKIASCLEGKRRIGRSRSAQYGLVEIRRADYTEIKSGFTERNDAVIYAESRLVFFDKNGKMTYQPGIEDLGFTAGEIDWSKSQIRTFCYAPWNFKRQCFDFDRLGIEKGSVIYVRNARFGSDKSEYVGAFNNEGFGKVIYNPDFFATIKGGNGLSAYEFSKSDNWKQTDASDSHFESILIKYLNSRKSEEKGVDDVYEVVNEFIKQHKKLFEGERFASQWGEIRRIANTTPDKTDLISKIKKYLEHGVAKEKWEEKSRAEALYDLFNSKEFTDRNAQRIIVNLASEMAKKCN